MISGDEAVIPGAVATIGGAGASVPGSGRAKAVLLRGECCHLAGEVLDPCRSAAFIPFGVSKMWGAFVLRRGQQYVGCFRSSSGSPICRCTCPFIYKQYTIIHHICTCISF